MKRVVTLLVTLALVGMPVWAMANVYGPSMGKPNITADNGTEMMSFQGAAASYNPATRVLTLTNGQKYIVAPHLTIEALSTGVPFDGTYQIEHGKRVLEAYWVEVGQVHGATL